MAIRVGVVEEPHHVAHLVAALRVLLADIPVQRERVAEACDEFAAVKASLHAEGAAVEGFRDWAGLARGAEAGVVHFVLLKFEMQIQPARRGVVEEGAPLVELRAVVVELGASRAMKGHTLSPSPPALL